MTSFGDAPLGEPARAREARAPAPAGGASGGAWSELEPSYTGDDPRFATRRARRGKRGRAVGFFLVAALAFVLGMGTGYARGYFATGAVGDEVTVVVPVGASLATIADRLAAKGVVKHARAFVIRAQSDGYSTKFKPGTYTFHQNEPYARLVALLTRGVKPPTTRISIPEGTTLRQAAGLVATAVPSITASDYLQVARDDPPTFHLGGYEPGTTLEGMLFPATYEVVPKATAATFVDLQLKAFDDNFANVDLSRARAANLTPYDVVIIASIIDREARVPTDRRLVSAVIWNRLHKGMLLQMCSTVEYALGKTKPVLTYDDLKIDSPYNTYKHAGLPPAPISNPGLAALRAAADPAAVDYLFFVARNDGTGRHYFSASYSQFLADQAKARANGE